MATFKSFKNTFLSAVSTSILWIIPTVGQVLPGAQSMGQYLPLLNKKNVGVVAHAASQIYTQNAASHLIDSLLSHQVNIIKIFAPEHGFRSLKDNGETIKNEIDSKTQLPIISLHGKHRKATAKQLENIDVILFDLQDVGVRFYTYLSTLHLTMQACAENNIPLIVLDRPNPNGHYVDGPVMEDQYKSFLGKHNIPIVYGMTLGEFAKMINGEGWLTDSVQCDLTVIKIKHYTHQTTYDLPIRPSPNLPNSQAINLYPSLCLFEQTPISVGRGTEMQFQIFGHPDLSSDFSFVPKANFGAKFPKLENQKCYGTDLTTHPKLSQLELKWLIDTYKNYPDKANFFSNRFVSLAGTKTLETQIKDGWSETEIRKSWSPKLNLFLSIRSKYLLYP